MLTTSLTVKVWFYTGCLKPDAESPAQFLLQVLNKQSMISRQVNDPGVKCDQPQQSSYCENHKTHMCFGDFHLKTNKIKKICHHIIHKIQLSSFENWKKIFSGDFMSKFLKKSYCSFVF